MPTSQVVPPIPRGEQALLDALPSHVAVLDERGVIIAVNAAWRRYAELHGYPDPDAGVGVNYLEICARVVGPAARTAASVAEGIRELLAGPGPAFELEYPCHGPGERRWFVAHVARLENSPTGRVVISHEEVTPFEAGAEALRLFERRLRIILGSLGVATWEWDVPSGAMTWSAHLDSLFGVDLPSGPFEYRRLASLIHPDDFPSLVEVARRALLEGREERTEFRVRRRGEIRWVAASWLVQRDNAGTPTRVLGLAMDVTDRHQAEAERLAREIQLLEAQKLESLGVLAGGIAHDFNNLLVGILSNAELALLDAPERSSGRPAIDQIRLAAVRAADLVRQLLAYAGQAPHRTDVVNLSALVDEIALLLRAAVPRHIDLIHDLAPHLPPAVGDTAQLGQVVLNLVTNAAEAIGDTPGTITLRTGLVTLGPARPPEVVGEWQPAPGPYLSLEVRDTGTGISPELRGRIFEPFFSTKAHGRGLGLSAVLGIVRRHGGALGVETELGVGSTFRVYLPTAPASAPEAEEPKPAPTGAAAGAGTTILVVDDEPAVRVAAGRLLERAGYTVATAESGNEAVDVVRAERERIGLVLLDLSMPGLSGDVVLRMIREIAPDLPVVLMTGYAKRAVGDRFEGLDLTGVLQKPFVMQELLGTVERALRGGPLTP